MKNLFLSVVLLLTISFAFAANNVETVSTFDDATVELTNIDFDTDSFSNVKVLDCGFTFSWDMGGSGDGPWGDTGSFWYECGEDEVWTGEDLLNAILELFF